MDSKLTWIFQDKCLIDYPENKRSLGILTPAHRPPLITVNRDGDQKKCRFLWCWTHGAFWHSGVGSKGASDPDGQLLDRGRCRVFEELKTSVHWLASAASNCFISLCQDFFLVKMQSGPMIANLLLPGYIKSLKWHPFSVFTGSDVNHVELTLRKEQSVYKGLHSCSCNELKYRYDHAVTVSVACLLPVGPRLHLSVELSLALLLAAWPGCREGWYWWGRWPCFHWWLSCSCWSLWNTVHVTRPQTHTGCGIWPEGDLTHGFWVQIMKIQATALN